VNGLTLNETAALLGGIPPALAYLLLACAVLAEAVLLLGAFVPTLTLLLTAGALSRAGYLDLPWVIAVATAAVICGDALAHRVGRAVGRGALTRRVPPAILERVRGGHSVLVCRFVPVARTVAPYLVGAGGLPYRAMAPYSALGAAVWATAEAGAGYAAAATLGPLLPVAVPALGAGALLILFLTRRFLTRRARPPGTRRWRPGSGPGTGSAPSSGHARAPAWPASRVSRRGSG
jgi:membrane protein DedA with SNARE-associated domain